MAGKTRICFICLGNIIRSPLAKGMFMHLASQEGVADQFEVDSAGISNWHTGEPPDARMRRVAASHGLIYDGQARQFKVQDFDRFDLILAMDRENQGDLLRIAATPEQRARVHLLREYDPDGGPFAPVPDPYYEGLDGFEEVYWIVERACRGLLDKLVSGGK